MTKTLSDIDHSGLLEYWQRQLRLQDWDIDVEIVRPLAIEGKAGDTRTTREVRQAWIRISDPSLSEQDFPEHFLDIEVTLVHELLHVAFAANIETHDEVEPAIDATARALVALNRGEKR